MPLPNELDDWLTEAGDFVVQKRATGEPIDSNEQLIYEIWLLDTQVRNGGVSQYFCNCPENWEKCVTLAKSEALVLFEPFARELNNVLSGARDAYTRILNRESEAGRLYHTHAPNFVAELRNRSNATEHN
jgi:hypothetical protein